jgi:hypothetical protein
MLVQLFRRRDRAVPGDASRHSVGVGH